MKRKTRALLVFPRFVNPSFWNLRDTCAFVDARHHAPPLGLITVAALLPRKWELRLIDCNVEELTDDHLAWADMVLTGGMMPQRAGALPIIARVQAAGKPVVVGGPDVTSSPELYAAADFRILGEAENVIDDFVAAWTAGTRTGEFQAPKFQVDVARSPMPRYDLLNFANYLYVGVQFSRGCPFTCEFCDIIELFGRVPRTKTTEQMLAELNRLMALGYRGHVDFVDDNLIGNKKAVKAFLPALIEWQKARNYPFRFSTEASINLADDPALLDLLSEAGFFSVFVGIESPDEDVLRAMLKKQNTRRDIAASVQKIYDAGIMVIGGFILGFDDETAGVGDRMIALIEDAAIPVCLPGLLYALPTTQLTTRLGREGRMYEGHTVDDEGELGDQCLAGLNFVTRRPRIDILRDYHRVVSAIYRPWAFFDRVARVGRRLRVAPEKATRGFRKKDEVRFLRFMGRAIVRRPAVALGIGLVVARCALSNRAALPRLMSAAMLYVDLGPFSRFVLSEISTHMDMIEAGAWIEPKLVPATTTAAEPSNTRHRAVRVAPG